MNQQLAEKLDDEIISSEDFFHIARLAIAGQGDDVRLFVAKMVRLHREDHPDFAEWLVAEGIQSISLNPDTVVATWQRLTKK